jgi:DNA repair protein RecO (recombination protein O)
MIINVKAMVIREYVVGESDKFVTLFTKEMGKIQASAPLAKKYTKGLTSGTQLFVYGNFTLSTYRDTYKIIHIETIRMFHHLREDLVRLSYATYIAEFILGVTYEQIEAQELLYLALLTMRQLENQEENFKLTRCIFEMRAMALLGFMPELKMCTLCGKALKEDSSDMHFFDIASGGIVCKQCKDSKLTYKMSYSTYYTLQYIVFTPLKALFQFQVTKEILAQLDVICKNYVSYYIDKSFKSLDFIKSIESM